MGNEYLQLNERSSRLREGRAFLSENPEAFGFVSDAFPIATDRWLIAASGQGTVGSAAPAYPVNVGGVDGLFDRLYGMLMERTDENADILARTFGQSEGRQEHPIARYSAALAETTALRVLTECGGAAFDVVLNRLGRELCRALSGLRSVICADGLTSPDPEFFSVSLGLCRITDEGDHTYTVDVFSAGDYHVFLMDVDGLRPMLHASAPPLTPEDVVLSRGRSLRLRHPGPFAVLMLSGSAFDITAAERRSVMDNHGMVWRYRMRLESYILRILTACTDADDFSECATRFFTGRAHGRDSASGAVAYLGGAGGDAAFDAFLSDCRARREKLAALIALLPDGYDPDAIVPQEPRADMENAFIRRLLTHDRDLVGALSDALYTLALDKLAGRMPPADEATLPDAPDYHRLTAEAVNVCYRIYDAENHADRALLAANRRAMRDHLAEHWITLRPSLSAACGDGEAPEMRARADAEYAACRAMNQKLGARLDARGEILDRLEFALSESLDILRAERYDWQCSRATDDRPAAWAETLADTLPAAIRDLVRELDTEGERYRSLLSAYMSEREALFARDTASGGFFEKDFSAMLEGTLPEGRWAAFAEAIGDAGEDMTPYLELIDTLSRICRGTGALLSRIASRAADRRMARDIAGRPELQIAAIRGAAYNDSDWGEAVIDVLDQAHRNNYKAALRHWQETRELMARRAAAYEEYRAMYEDEMGGRAL